MADRREPTTAPAGNPAATADPTAVGATTEPTAPAANQAHAAASPAGAVTVERLGGGDLLHVAYSAEPAGAQVGAVLTFAPGADLTLAKVRRELAARVPAVPRLRRRLYRTPLGHGRPLWVDDPDFDVRWHVGTLSCPPPGDERALLHMAARLVTTPLPVNRSLWSATLVTGLADGGTALVICAHHVLASGIGGLAALATLVAGGDSPPDAGFPVPAPTGRRLRADAWQSRRVAAARARTVLRRLPDGLTELRPTGVRLTARCSLNRRCGPHRRLAVARVDLAAVRRAAHAHGATVHDLVLSAVTGALGTVLLTRGEPVRTLTVPFPVLRPSGRTQRSLGASLLPIALPATGTRTERLERTAALTRVRKAGARGAALLAALFHALAAVGLLRWFTNHQRLVHTFVTNVRGPVAPLPLFGTHVTGIVPIAAVAGNVTVAFAALSYAGTLTVTVVADPDGCPDLPYLAERLQHELDAYAIGDDADPS